MDWLLGLLTGRMVSPLPGNVDMQTQTGRDMASWMQNNHHSLNSGYTQAPQVSPQIQHSGPQVLAAEASPTPTSTPQPTTFWDHFSNLVREKAAKEGFNPDVLIRQKALESAYGTSNFAQNRNNFGGVGAYDADPNNAYSYSSPAAYLDAYFKLIKNKYPQAYQDRANPEQYVTDLKNGGYATDPQYVWKVLNTPLDR